MTLYDQIQKETKLAEIHGPDCSIYERTHELLQELHDNTFAKRMMNGANLVSLVEEVYRDFKKTSDRPFFQHQKNELSEILPAAGDYFPRLAGVTLVTTAGMIAGYFIGGFMGMAIGAFMGSSIGSIPGQVYEKHYVVQQAQYLDEILAPEENEETVPDIPRIRTSEVFENAAD